jgi:hypothetical protein
MGAPFASASSCQADSSLSVFASNGAESFVASRAVELAVGLLPPNVLVNDVSR